MKFRALLFFLAGLGVGIVVPAAAQPFPPSPVENQLVIRSDGFIFLIRDGMRHLVSPIAMSDEEINALLEGEPYLNGLVPVEAMSAVVAQPATFNPPGLVAENTSTPTPSPSPSASPSPTRTSTPGGTSTDFNNSSLEVPSTRNRGDKITIKVKSLPGGARCKGEVNYKGGAEDGLKEIGESTGECKWEFEIDSSAQTGEAKVEVEAWLGGSKKKLEGKFEVK